MEGILEIEPRQIPFRGTVALEHYVESRIEPEYREEDVMDMVKGPGGGKAKRKKVGTQMVATGRLHVKLTMDNGQGYLMTYGDEEHASAMYHSIRVAVHNGGGYCTDLTEEEVAAERAGEQEVPAEGTEIELPQDGTGKYHVESHDQQGGVTAGEVTVNEPPGPPPTVEELEEQGAIATQGGAAAKEVEAEGYDAEPEFQTNRYTCKACQCEYSFECADPKFEIACPDCDTINAPDEVDLLA